MSQILNLPKIKLPESLVTHDPSHVGKKGLLRGATVSPSPASSDITSLADHSLQLTCAHAQCQQSSSRRLLEAKCRMINASSDFLQLINGDIEESDEEIRQEMKRLDKKQKERSVVDDRTHKFVQVSNVMTHAALITSVATAFFAPNPITIAIAGYSVLSQGYKALQGTGAIPTILGKLGIKDSETKTNTEDRITKAVSWTDFGLATSTAAIGSLGTIAGISVANIRQTMNGLAWLPTWLGNGVTGAASFLSTGAAKIMSYPVMQSTANALQKFAPAPSTITGLSLVISIGQSLSKIGQAYTMSQSEILTADITQMEGRVSNITLGSDAIFEMVRTLMSRMKRNQEYSCDLLEEQDKAHSAISEMKV